VTRSARELPFISVVVPTYQRSRQFRECLESLSKARYPRESFEVIVVDDGGTEALDPVLHPFRDRMQMLLVRQRNAGPATARNSGAAKARGDLVAFVDDDCRPSSGWIPALADCCLEAPGAMIGGRTVNALADNPYATASSELLDYLHHYYNRGSDGASFFTANNMAVPADRFREIGGFDPNFPLAAGEDRELCDRWRQSGFGLAHAPNAVVHHAHEMDFRGFVRQHFNYGRGAHFFHRSRARRGSGRIRVEPPSFYGNLIRWAASRGRGGRRLLNVSLILLSQVANALGFFYQSASRREPRTNFSP
jgi:GT2 family glycosyltransferase